MTFVQASLLGREAPSLDPHFGDMMRHELAHDAWVEHLPGFVRGHESLLEELCVSTRFRTTQQTLYDRTVDVPRLVAGVPEDGAPHPLFEDVQALLAVRYGEPFPRVSLALYRDGADSVAWHGDRIARKMHSTFVATVSLGEPRRFLLREYGGGPSTAFTLGWGDLFVMGGTCQRTWQHSVPKVARAGPRLAIMFRPAWSKTY